MRTVTTTRMFRPTINDNQRGYDLFANATYHRPLKEDDRDMTCYEEPKNQVKSVQERERDAAISLLLMRRMHRHQRKECIAPGSKQHRVCHHRQREEEHQRSTKSSLFDSLILQHQQDKRPRTTGLDERKWNQRIKDVEGFVLEHRHGRIPVSYPGNQDLARWSKRQRYHYKVYLKNKMKQTTSLVGKPFKIERCHMTQRRLKSLNDAGFCFDLHVAKWDRSYELLKQNKLCSTKYTLKKWIGTQRFQMSLLKRGKKSFLNPKRIQKLNEIGFSWQDDEWVSKSTKTIGYSSPIEEEEQQVG